MFSKSGLKKPSPSLALAYWLVVATTALSVTGCAGYKLGPSNGLAGGQKSVQIRPFSNLTLEPRLTDAVTLELRRELQRDSTFRLASQDDGDIVVSGVITHYVRNEMSLSSGDTLTVRDYRLSLTAKVTARERGTGRILFDQPVVGYTLIRVNSDLTGALIRVGSDLSSTERQALPLLAGDLAKNVASLLADGSW